MLLKILNIERVDYFSKMKLDDFLARINNLSDRNSSKLGYDISGKLFSHNRFRFSKRFKLFGAEIKSIESDLSYVNGKVIENNGLNIKVWIRPNAVFSIFGILFSVVGIIAFIDYFFNSASVESLIVGILFILIGPICYLIGKEQREKLKKQFESYFNLNN